VNSYNVVANVAKAVPQAPAQRAQAHPTTAPIAQPPQDPSISSPAVEALWSLRLTEYPKSWFYNPENPGLAQEAAMTRMKQLERAYENAGVVARPLVKLTEVEGKEIQVVRSLQYPSPAPQNSIFADKTFIRVSGARGSNGRARQSSWRVCPSSRPTAGRSGNMRVGPPSQAPTRISERYLKSRMSGGPMVPTRKRLTCLPRKSKRHVVQMVLAGSQANFWGISMREPPFLILRPSSPPANRPKTSSRQPRAAIYPSFRVQPALARVGATMTSSVSGKSMVAR
jgi:hypothetical protein